jgi:hypothetical protein
LRADDDLAGRQKFARVARQRREHIREVLKRNEPLIVSSTEGVPLSTPSDTVSQFSNPAFQYRLPFPHIGPVRSDRFTVDDNTEDKIWHYMGREKFADLMHDFEDVRANSAYSALYVYGTRGYGKSHLLAAAVCALVAKEQRVVYIPDCRVFSRCPVEYMKMAMLFAWADDKSKQDDIAQLHTEEQVTTFFQIHGGDGNLVFVIDQLNALEVKEEDNATVIKNKEHSREWLNNLTFHFKSIFSSSANNHTLVKDEQKHMDRKLMKVYGGFTKVGLRASNFTCTTSDFNLDGNEMLVEVESQRRSRRLYSRGD